MRIGAEFLVFHLYMCLYLSCMSCKVVELLISLQESQMETDDPMRICILEVCCVYVHCFCKFLSIQTVFYEMNA